jgi:hypothetical protein
LKKKREESEAYRLEVEMAKAREARTAEGGQIIQPMPAARIIVNLWKRNVLRLPKFPSTSARSEIDCEMHQRVESIEDAISDCRRRQAALGIAPTHALKLISLVSARTYNAARTGSPEVAVWELDRL